MPRRSILVLYTGGTIGMRNAPDGLVPEPGFVRCLESALAFDAQLEGFQCTVERVDPVIDSADAKPDFWIRLARRLWEARDRFDGFVVLHGTDTMAYTASALSFFLAGFDKSVVLSGAQVPITRTGSDAEANLSGAVMCACEPLLREVAIFFGGLLLRGNRARKWSSSARKAFCSPRWPPLARLVHDTVMVDESALLRRRPLHRPVPRTDFCLPVGNLKLYPGISPELVQLAGVVNIGGLVVEMYGAGTGPARDTELLHVIGRLTNRGTPVVGVSQCFNGELTPVLYATSRAFSEAGLIDGRDLTPEAALTKLVYLRCLEVPASDMATRIAEDIAGEISSGATVA